MGSKKVRDASSQAVICPECILRQVGDKSGNHKSRHRPKYTRPWVPFPAVHKKKKKVHTLNGWVYLKKASLKRKRKERWTGHFRPRGPQGKARTRWGGAGTLRMLTLLLLPRKKAAA